MINALAKLWKKNHRAEILEGYRKDRLMVLRHYGGDPPKCACCGVDIYVFLAIDHIFGRKTGTKFDKLTGPTLCGAIIGAGFPPLFQILCHNCNAAKGILGKCPHQQVKELDRELNEFLSTISSSKNESEKTTEILMNSPTQSTGLE